MAATRRILSGLGIVAALAAPAVAGAQQLDIRVVDDRGNPVAFAVVTAMPGGTRVADESGRLEFRTAERGDILLRVRRMGYRPTEQTARRGDSVTVRLEPIARTLDAVEVTEQVDTPLSRTGFYDRMERVQRGAIVGDFITPEELSERNPMTAGRALDGSRYARVRPLVNGKIVVTGRGGCNMTVIVDGVRIDGSMQDIPMFGDPTSIDQRGTSQGRDGTNPTLFDLNSIVGGNEIMAIEVYPSSANAPVELQRLGGRGSCGIVAIWTGGRH